MTKKQNTKKALLISITSLVLCVAMLAGSTFAWFTDEAGSTENIIVAGNLDVELQVKKGTSYENVGAEENIFKDVLWEPGHIEVVQLKIANVGTLNTAYDFSLKAPADEAEVPNALGGTFKLSNYIKYIMVDSDEEVSSSEINTRGKVKAVIDRAERENTAYTLSQNAGFSGKLKPKGEEKADKYIIIIAYMPETIENEANYRGDTAPELKLGLNLKAYQTPAESDSFDNQYDADARPKNIGFTVTIAPWVFGEVCEYDMGKFENVCHKSILGN